ncbi:hypothetical protein [Actinophytocola sp.]|uniref:hypothetical protein n=1 Tax=Actinophytocola sp. TaxID=1872138 RepID=UPI002ED0DB6A
MNQLGQFEQNLLTELREVVAEQASVPPPRRALLRGRLALTTAGVGLLAAGLLIGVPAMYGDRTSPAYAVTNNDDGTVTVMLNRLEDPEGLERELAAHGITAEVDFSPPGKQCRISPPRYEEQPQVRSVVMGVADSNSSFTLWPADVEGMTLVVAGWRDPADPEANASAQYTFHYTAVSGQVRRVLSGTTCVLIEAGG